MDLIRCPYCNESYYREGVTMSTASYYPPIIKNGVNINPDRNIHSTYCKCLNCGKSFTIKRVAGEVEVLKND